MATRIGGYILKRRLGGEGSGGIFLAETVSTGEAVAVKVLDKKAAEDKRRIERFEREAEAIRSIDHPNVVRLLGNGKDKGRYFLAMEYHEGQNLASLLEERGSLPHLDAVDIARSVTRALTAAADRGIVHRDIKPSNILVGADGSVKVLDFGIAKFAARPRENDLTRGSEFLGTVQYTSPEQARSDAVDSRSDIYSLGVVLYEMLVGEPPFPRARPGEVLETDAEWTPSPPSVEVPDIPLELDAIVLRMLARDPDARFTTPATLLEALDAFLEKQVPLVGEAETTDHVQVPRAGDDLDAALGTILGEALEPIRVSLPRSRDGATAGDARRAAVVTILVALAGVLGVLGVLLWLRTLGS